MLVKGKSVAHLTEYSIPALLNPMINKMADEASAILLLIFSNEVWVKVTKNWSTACPRPCAYACAYVDPFFTSQSYDISISTRRTNSSVFLVLMLMSPQFSLAYTCALCLCASENQAYKHLGSEHINKPHCKMLPSGPTEPQAAGHRTAECLDNKTPSTPKPVSSLHG